MQKQKGRNRTKWIWDSGLIKQLNDFHFIGSVFKYINQLYFTFLSSFLKHSAYVSLDFFFFNEHYSSVDYVMFQKIYPSLNSPGKQCGSCRIGSGSLGVCNLLHQLCELQSGTCLQGGKGLVGQVTLSLPRVCSWWFLNLIAEMSRLLAICKRKNINFLSVQHPPFCNRLHSFCFC